AEGATGLEESEPFEHLDRVVVALPGEDPALPEEARGLDRVLVADTHREGRGALVEPRRVSDPEQMDAIDPADPVEEPGRELALVRLERRVAAADRRTTVGLAADPRDVVDRRGGAGHRLVALRA